MTENEYRRQHSILWRNIVDYLCKVKLGEIKTHYKSIADLKSVLINTQHENDGVVFTGVYNNCYACEFVLKEKGNDINICVECPLINKLGSICYDNCTGAYTLLVKAYNNQDYEKAIKFAIQIRDAWRNI